MEEIFIRRRFDCLCGACVGFAGRRAGLSNQVCWATGGAAMPEANRQRAVHCDARLRWQAAAGVAPIATSEVSSAAENTLAARRRPLTGAKGRRFG